MRYPRRLSLNCAAVSRWSGWSLLGSPLGEGSAPSWPAGGRCCRCRKPSGCCTTSNGLGRTPCSAASAAVPAVPAAPAEGDTREGVRRGRSGSASNRRLLVALSSCCSSSPAPGPCSREGAQTGLQVCSTYTCAQRIARPVAAHPLVFRCKGTPTFQPSLCRGEGRACKTGMTRGMSGSACGVHEQQTGQQGGLEVGSGVGWSGATNNGLPCWARRGRRGSRRLPTGAGRAALSRHRNQVACSRLTQDTCSISCSTVPSTWCS